MLHSYFKTAVVCISFLICCRNRNDASQETELGKGTVSSALCHVQHQLRGSSFTYF